MCALYHKPLLLSKDKLLFFLSTWRSRRAFPLASNWALCPKKWWKVNRGSLSSHVCLCCILTWFKNGRASSAMSSQEHMKLPLSVWNWHIYLCFLFGQFLSKRSLFFPWHDRSFINGQQRVSLATSLPLELGPEWMTATPPSLYTWAKLLRWHHLARQHPPAGAIRELRCGSLGNICFWY